MVYTGSTGGIISYALCSQCLYSVGVVYKLGCNELRCPLGVDLGYKSVRIQSYQITTCKPNLFLLIIFLHQDPRYSIPSCLMVKKTTKQNILHLATCVVASKKNVSEDAGHIGDWQTMAKKKISLSRKKLSIPNY